MKGYLFFGILFVIFGVRLFLKVKAPSTPEEPNNPEFGMIGVPFSLTLVVGGVAMIVFSALNFH